MCSRCWAKVPPLLQLEVYRTVDQRARHIDHTWAPWWRAQARAIAHVAGLVEPDEAKMAAYLTRALRFADQLEGR